METGIIMTLTEFERQTLTYLLYTFLESETRRETIDGEEEITFSLTDGFSGSEVDALSGVHARIQKP